MEKMTITEALSEINLIKKKLEKKKQNVLVNLVRAKHIKDPLESEGGSKVYASREVQSITDLQKRLVDIKTAIAIANISTELTISGRTKTIFNWLIWKRDVSDDSLKFTRNIHSQIKNSMDQNTRGPTIYKDSTDKTQLVEFEYSLDYASALKEEQEIQDIIEKLDGQLSLKNATVVLEF